ncbi:amidohydrolase, PncC family [Noviherbaspirillum humi]|uniref:Amidohydrolase, PncC family n=1 Tax=Noviherbaspirillum humi TaxID=1688639 RepID=A0A239J5L2_9BURK|nr:CinA family protein [Noviherbaspirillum humi]SNT00768.1 amidohydrolase, PncC family [Noviherbaspirillum humi]
MDKNRLQKISRYFEEHQIRLATAESCTAGLIAGTLGDLPGCGGWLECGFVTYSPEAKNMVLGVKFDTIERYNLTSEQVAREMVEGALHGSRANIAVSNTGVAGPSSGDAQVPVGTICFAWGFEFNGAVVIYSETKKFDGDRNQIRQAGADYAIERILFYHEHLPGGVMPRAN